MDDDLGIYSDSQFREGCFSLAARTYGLDYGVLYDAWLDEKPIKLADRTLFSL